MNPKDAKFMEELHALYPSKSDIQIMHALFKDMTEARQAAFLYYEDAVTLRTALAERLNHNPMEYVVYDEIVQKAKDVFVFRDKYIHSEIDAERAGNVRRIIEDAVTGTLKAMGVAKPKRKADRKPKSKKRK